MRIFRREITESTNIDAREGVPGDVFTAEFQTAGRGRLDHEWQSERGLNLMFSAVLDVCGLELAETATLPLVVGLALVKALASFAGDGRLTLKWPNDVLLGGRKLAGVLCELNGGCVIAGVGINVNQTEFPPAIANRAVSLAMAAGGENSPVKLDRERVLTLALESIFAWHARWRREGFAGIYPEFAAVDHLAGREVAVFQTDGDPKPVAGICGGIQRNGTLLVGTSFICAGEAHVQN